ncbi:MAG: GH1 family beta-glucosidase [Firmicutes bacterium]|nr:GH1 family beta-glucosidase [Bacillota bacterium]
MGFREDMVWGTATASFQIEGGAASSERGFTVWDDFCARPGKIADGSDGTVACDHYHRWREDISLMRELGYSAYRLSLSWARLFPEGAGSLNQEGAAFYDALFDALLQNGITPYVTLFHWDLPYALYQRGGWMNPDIVSWFGNYAQAAATLYGDRVKHFITLNEPQCFIGLGHVSGEHAPGAVLSRRSVLTMAHHALMAHGMAAQRIRKIAPDAKIGIAPTSTVACPATDSAEDIQAARDAYFGAGDPENYMWNVSWWSDPLFFGTYPAEGLARFEGDLPEFGPGDMRLIAQPLDFYGQNIYNGYSVKSDGAGGVLRLSRPLGSPRTANYWPVVPESLYWGPKFLYERYKTPIVITENGVSCTDPVCLDGRIHDFDRIDFYRRYLRELRRAAEEGTDIRGYFAWSFLDNFEWARGFTERFGLVHVDYQTQNRRPKDSAYWYGEVCRKNGDNI